MKKRWKFTALGLAFAGFVAAAPARAADVDQRIQVLEDELQRLKSEQAQVKSEQIEMRKEATAAAAALPNFSYRPGNGLNIEAADKSWAFRASMEVAMRLLFESGSSHVGRETGGLMGRRFRPTFDYCINNCLYDIETSIDLDGYGTGNAKNSTNTGGSSILQRGIVWVHMENINPWLPTFYFGMDGPASISTYRQGGSSTGAQLEYDMLSRNNGFNTGRFGSGFGLNWDDKNLSGIGIPGRLVRFNLVAASIGEGDDGLQSFKQQKNYSAYVNVEPFSQVKNKWIQGLGLEFGAFFCNNDSAPEAQNACDRLQIRDNGDGGRQTLFDTGANIGTGMATFLMPGLQYRVGPYTLRAVGGFQHYNSNNEIGTGKVEAHNFLIGHDIWMWSPKGFFTGSNNTAGSILFGTHFERTDASCGTPGCTVTDGTFARNTILLREWDLWYFLAPRMSVGATVAWYNATNLPMVTQQNLGIRNEGVAGKGGQWVDFSITYRYIF